MNPIILTQYQYDLLVAEEWRPESRMTPRFFRELCKTLSEGSQQVLIAKEQAPLETTLEIRQLAWARGRPRFQIQPQSQCLTFNMTAQTSDRTPNCLHVQRKRLHPANFILWVHGGISGQEAANWGHRYVTSTGVRMPILQGRKCDTFGCCNPNHYGSVLLPYAQTPLTFTQFPTIGDLGFNWDLANY